MSRGEFTPEELAEAEDSIRFLAESGHPFPPEVTKFHIAQLLRTARELGYIPPNR